VGSGLEKEFHASRIERGRPDRNALQKASAQRVCFGSMSALGNRNGTHEHVVTLTFQRRYSPCSCLRVRNGNRQLIKIRETLAEALSPSWQLVSEALVRARVLRLAIAGAGCNKKWTVHHSRGDQHIMPSVCGRLR